MAFSHLKTCMFSLHPLKRSSLEQHTSLIIMRSLRRLSNDVLSHISIDGQRPTMVDVGNKAATQRHAVASCKVILPSETLEALGAVRNSPGDHRNPKDLTTKKGPIVTTAIIAGVMAAKKTSDIIPFCHPLPIDFIGIDISWHSEHELKVACSVKVRCSTGVEMEAMTGASAAALCIYDMCKASSHDIKITDLQLESKTGGKRHFDRDSIDK